MTDELLVTTPPDEGRGCGNRDEGGLYACLGVGEGDVPIWSDLVDPAIPYTYEPFLGIQPAPAELMAGFPPEWQEENVLLIDWVGAEYYPSVPSAFEEIRRFGMSRRIQNSFNFSRFAGKQLWLALIHPRAVHEWAIPDSAVQKRRIDTTVASVRPQALELPHIRYWPCKRPEDEYTCMGDPVGNTHYPSCLFHLWPLSSRLHKKASDKIGMLGSPLIKRPSFHFSPWFPAVWTDLHEMTAAVAWLPKVKYSPGIFAIHPITHLEAVKWIDPEANLDGSPPIVVTKE